MTHRFVALLAGLIFSVGLVISGMTNPNVVRSFLDIFGDWDPALLFVMGGAVAVNLVSFRLILKKPNPLLENEFYLPGNNKVDKKLVIGSAIFGIGWGLMGICPGPALVNIVRFDESAIAFVLAMLAGMYAHFIAFKKRGA